MPPTSVLITGESGTGKEMVARALHDESPQRRSRSWSSTAAPSPRRSWRASSSATRRAPSRAPPSARGLFEQADRGTIFLDEIGELPLALQVKLLRVLQERMVRPVGARKRVPVDVRVIAATNRDLDEEVRRGGFRQDLYYRLNVIRIELPPLRDRPEDIPPLAQHLLAQARPAPAA